jgi:2-deoxy-D-gluconate 3-dehydrogenase
MSKQTIAELFDLTGKGAVVTGGAMGIGKAIVERLCEAGAGVMIADLNEDAANQTAEEIQAAGGNARAIQADAGNAADGIKVAQAAVETFGSLDILVNNAGIYPFSPVLDTTEELWDKVLNTNLKGVFLYSQAAARVMAKAKKGGKIINMCSVDALKPTGMIAHYNASKGGALMLTKALALELAPMNILVNAIAPGGIATPGTANLAETMLGDAGLDPEEITREFINSVPLARWGEPDDIAKVALFLASSASDYMCGEMVVVDGGILLK